MKEKDPESSSSDGTLFPTEDPFPATRMNSGGVHRYSTFSYPQSFLYAPSIMVPAVGRGIRNRSAGSTIFALRISISSGNFVVSYCQSPNPNVTETDCFRSASFAIFMSLRAKTNSFGMDSVLCRLQPGKMFPPPRVLIRIETLIFCEVFTVISSSLKSERSILSGNTQVTDA